MKIILSLMTLLLLTLSHLSYAGERGFNVVFIDISEAPYNDGVQVAMKLRQDRKYAKNNNCAFCESSDQPAGTIGVLYIKNTPQDITKEIARAAIYNHDTHAIKYICDRLAQYKDPDNYVPDGLDGAYFYARDKDKVTIYAISSRPSRSLKFISASHPVKYYISEESLDQLFKETMMAFWDGFRVG